MFCQFGKSILTHLTYSQVVQEFFFPFDFGILLKLKSRKGLLICGLLALHGKIAC